MTQHSQLTFKPLDAQSSSSPSRGYTWEYSGTAEVRVGPDQEEIDELRREDPDDSATRDKYLNQCLFVRTLNVTLNDDDWKSLSHEIGIGYVPSSSTERGTGKASLSPSNQDPSSIPQPTSSPSGNFGTKRRADGPAMELISLGTTAHRLTISVPPAATVSRIFEKEVICSNLTLFQSCHPSRIINKALLEMVRRILI
jgi:hypothetical protein